MLDNDTFYARIHPPMARSVARFGSSWQKLRIHGANRADESALLAASSELLCLARITCGLAPRLPGGKFSDFCADAAEFTAAIAHSDISSVSICARECATHLAYLEQHEGFAEVRDAELPGTWLAWDFLCNLVGAINTYVFSLYKWRSQDPRHATSFFLAEAAEDGVELASLAHIKTLQDHLPGWCSYDKAVMLYSLVREYKPEVAVEIGIHGGRSIIPIALALRDNKAGHVVGVETWSTEAITGAGITETKNDFGWSVADFGAIKRSFLNHVIQEDLHGYIKLLELSSERAARVIDEIQFIHIDGNHSMCGAARDVGNYLPKLCSGGVIVFDDIEWPSTGPAVELLMDTCRLLHVTGSFGNPSTPSCAAFIKL